MANLTEKLIERLKAEGLYDAALKKFASYLNAHRRQHCQSLSIKFSDFASDILATPAHLRHDLLKTEMTEEERELARMANKPSVRFRVYEAPKTDEMNVGLSTRPKQKKKSKPKPKPKAKAKKKQTLRRRRQNVDL